MHTKAASSKEPRAYAAAGNEGSIDPLRYFEPLPLESMFYPLGYSVRLCTNSPDIMAAASGIWGAWERMSDAPPIELRLGATDRKSVRPSPVPLPSAQGHLMTMVHSIEDFGTADVSRGYIFGWVTAGIAADHGYLQYHFLQPLVYVTLGCLYLAPVHASCVALSGKGILLCGDSGAGKTSLAYGLARRGWTYVGDDAAYLVRRARGAQVIGRPHHIRFRSSAKTIFPELSAFPEVARQNGNMDLELSTSDLRLDSVAPTTEVAMLVFLRREAGSPVRLDPLDRDLAQERFERVINLGPAEVREEQRAALRKLTRLPAYTMTYWDLDAAGIALRKLLRSE